MRSMSRQLKRCWKIRVSAAVAAGARDHLVIGVARRGLGDAEVAQLPLLLFAQQGRRDDVERVVVAGRRHPVQLVDVDVVGGELLERAVERGDGALRCRAGLADAERRLGADHHLLARHASERPAEHRLGAVGGGGVEQIDPEIEGGADDADGVRLAVAGAEPQAAEAAAAEPGDADPEPGAPERGVIHLMPSCR